MFVLVGALTGTTPWFLTPVMAMLAYGYCFNMGFLNYYVSIGLACWSLGIFLGGTRTDRLVGFGILPVIYLAHPIGFLFALGMMVYLAVRQMLPGLWKLAVPLVAIAAVAVLHWVLATRVDFDIDWTKTGPFYVFNGSDQLVLYGDHYAALARAAVLFGVICVVVDAVMRRKERASWGAFALPMELYVTAFVILMLLPENLRSSPEVAWMGLLVSRLTLVSAIFGLRCWVA